jgi:mannose-6-phosphate isomerase-like protein (cupin superfamily)
MMYKSSFVSYELVNGLLADISDDAFPTKLWSWSNDVLNLRQNNATHFGYVYRGSSAIEHASGTFNVSEGMYFSAPGEVTIRGSGGGIAISRIDYDGFFHVGGPVEHRGRLKYIDGCTDSLLIPPIMMGDPCLNLLYFPPGVKQTQHTHPSMRLGIVIRGRGECITPSGTTALEPGRAFLIPAEGVHGFVTEESDMAVIAYHPDSDFGPTHEVHPMINRTIVDGVSARLIEEIRTK